MIESQGERSPQVDGGEWVAFQGGELEGIRPKVMCPVCRARRLAHKPSPLAQAMPRPLCFQCYRLSLDRARALRAAAELDTSSVERFQDGLPFEPVSRPRLERL